MPFGMWDVKGFIEDGGAEQFVEYTNQMLERIVAALKRCTYEIEKAGGTDESLCVQCVMISNMEGYAFRQLTNMKGTKKQVGHLTKIEKRLFHANSPLFRSGSLAYSNGECI